MYRIPHPLGMRIQVFRRRRSYQSAGVIVRSEVNRRSLVFGIDEGNAGPAILFLLGKDPVLALEVHCRIAGQAFAVFGSKSSNPTSGFCD